MGNRSTIFVVTVGALALAALLSWSDRIREAQQSPRLPPGHVVSLAHDEGAEAPPTGSRVEHDEPRPASVNGTGTVAARAPAPTAVAADEASLMKVLHELHESAPSVSLRLAKDGNDRFGESAGAAEREWIIVKALTNLGRFEEAQAEARLMVEEYPGTSYAADVERHLLTNPLHPTDD